MKSPTEYRKGRMGYMLDMRKAMKRLSQVSNEWCRAFDAGDEEAFENLGQIFKETLEEITDAHNALEGLSE